MSIYDKASLVLIPSGSKTSKVYSQKPVSGDGDFTFSRSTAATRVNADGVIEKETQNLLPRSNTFNTGWSPVSGTFVQGVADPFGGNDAWSFTAGNTDPYFYSQTAWSGVLTLSIYAKGVGSSIGKPIQLRMGGSHKSYTLTSEWQRFEHFANGSHGSVGIEVPNPAVAGDVVHIYGAQLEYGLVARDYIETTTTAVEGGITDNVPRLDYTDSSCPALLLEPQRTNGILFSEYRQGSDAVDFRITTTSNAAISPEGLQNATLLTENTDTNTHFHSIGSVSWVSGTTYTISAYVKSNGRDLHLGVGNPAVIQFTTTYDLTNGVVLSSYATSSSIEDAGNGWWRVTATATAATSSGTNILPFLYNGATNYAGDGTSGIYVWGFQKEEGSYATSYIPTYGSAVTRNAEACIDSDASSIIGQTEGTLFFEFDNQPLANQARYFCLSDGSGSNRIDIYQNSLNNLGIYVATSAVAQINVTNVSVPSSGTIKFALNYANDNYVWYVNGSQVGSDTNASVPALNHTLIGASSDGAARSEKNLVRQVMLFKTRLSNEELADLTTL